MSSTDQQTITPAAPTSATIPNSAAANAFGGGSNIKRGGATGGRSAKRKGDTSAMHSDEIKSIKFIKRAPVVDPHAQLDAEARIVEEEPEATTTTTNQIPRATVYDVLLIDPHHGSQYDNFVIMQLIEVLRTSTFVLFTRSGTVGSKGNTNKAIFKALDKAKREFKKRFFDYTHNKWEDRDHFNKFRGKYQYIEFDFHTEPAKRQAATAAKVEQQQEEPSLDEQLEQIIAPPAKKKQQQQQEEGEGTITTTTTTRTTTTTKDEEMQEAGQSDEKKEQKEQEEQPRAEEEEKAAGPEHEQEEEEEEEEEEDDDDQHQPPTPLDPRVEQLLLTISDTNMFRSTLESFDLDTSKIDLNRLDRLPFARAYACLSAIEDALNSSKKQQASPLPSPSSASAAATSPTSAAATATIEQLSKQFYELIPHATTRRAARDTTTTTTAAAYTSASASASPSSSSSPPLINSTAAIKDKIDMLDTLRDIQVAMSIVQKAQKRVAAATNKKAESEAEDKGQTETAMETATATATESEDYDAQRKKRADTAAAIYKLLRRHHRVKITPVDKDTKKEFEAINKYVLNNSDSAMIPYDLEVQNIFKLERDDGDANANANAVTEAATTTTTVQHDKTDINDNNRRLLFLLSNQRLSNFLKLLSRGITPPHENVPKIGIPYNHHHAAVFSDVITKSANNCCVKATDPIGCVLLCDVALGDRMRVISNKAALDAYVSEDASADDNSSVCVRGKSGPDWTSPERLDGTAIPVGKCKRHQEETTSLLYNEYIVTNLEQVKPKYLLQLRFSFKF